MQIVGWWMKVPSTMGGPVTATFKWDPPGVPHIGAKAMLQYHDEFTQTTMADAYVSSWVANGQPSGSKRVGAVYLDNVTNLVFTLNVSPDTWARMCCEVFQYQ